MANYNYIDLFHGVGGFALGAYLAGMKFDNHFCSDIEPHAVELYEKRFPDSIQLGDITGIDPEELKWNYPGEWILTGGFPCQDISIAGKGKGIINGKRSNLWFEFLRLIGGLRPQFTIIENVGALVGWFDCERRPTPPENYNEGDEWSLEVEQQQGIARVISDLAEIGYHAEWQSLFSCQFGVPTQRQRVWIIGYSNSKRLEGNTSYNDIFSEKKRIRRDCRGYKTWDYINTQIMSKQRWDTR